jgi:two-component system, cell cycle sensor histidine kinase and response regulator CckA
VAHEFNNLLTAIMIYGDLLAEAAGEEAHLRQLAREIREAGCRGASLTRHLLALSRPSRGKEVALSLGALVRSMRPLLQHLAGEGIDLRVRRGGEGDRLRANPGELQQVLLNLVANARDAMPGGGKLLVETSRLEVAPGEAPPAGLVDRRRERAETRLEPGSYVALRVKDSGSGMSAETQRRIFQPFFTTKAGRGTGLGLAAVWEIVRRTGGHIGVESSPGQGTVMSLYWPASPGSAPPPRAEKPQGQEKPLPGAGETVLVAEADDGVRRSLRRALSELGYRVLTARDAAAAQRMARRRRPIDVLLVGLPEVEPGDGGLVGRLRQCHPGMKVVYLCEATSLPQAEGRGREGYALLRKPFPGVLLARTLRQVLAARKPS